MKWTTVGPLAFPRVFLAVVIMTVTLITRLNLCFLVDSSHQVTLRVMIIFSKVCDITFHFSYHSAENHVASSILVITSGYFVTPVDCSDTSTDEEADGSLHLTEVSFSRKSGKGWPDYTECHYYYVCLLSVIHFLVPIIPRMK